MTVSHRLRAKICRWSGCVSVSTYHVSVRPCFHPHLIMRGCHSLQSSASALSVSLITERLLHEDSESTQSIARRSVRCARLPRALSGYGIIGFLRQPPQLARDRQEGNPDLLHIGVLVVTKSEPKDLANFSDRFQFIHLTPPSTCIPRAPPLCIITFPTPQHERHNERNEHGRSTAAEHDAVHRR